LGEDRIVILSTHIVGDVEETCSRMAVISDGQVSYTGSPADFISPAEGFVWEFNGDTEDLDALMNEPNLVQVREVKRGLQFRVVSSQAPRSNARPVQPTLEDAYVYFVNPREAA